MPRRLGTIATLVAALAVFVVGGYVIVHKDPVANAGQTPGFTSPARAGSTQASHVPSGGRSPSASTLVAFLGDDYTAGAGASDSAHAFVPLVARRLGVETKRFSVPFGGYAKVSSGGQIYADRVMAIVAARPDVVVVSGGRNDASDYKPTLAAKVTALFAALHKRLPNATVVAVAPFWGDSDEPPELVALGGAVRAAVRAAGGTYLNLPDPLHGHPNWMADGSDPNDRGHAEIARVLEPALAPLLLPH